MYGFLVAHCRGLQGKDAVKRSGCVNSAHTSRNDHPLQKQPYIVRLSCCTLPRPPRERRSKAKRLRQFRPQSSKIKLSVPMMLDHIKLRADFTTTCLTTYRTGLPGDSSTQRTLYQFFRTKKHVLDAISRKKLHPFAWGARVRKFKSCHSDHIECS